MNPRHILESLRFGVEFYKVIKELADSVHAPGPASSFPALMTQACGQARLAADISGDLCVMRVSGGGQTYDVSYAPDGTLFGSCNRTFRRDTPALRRFVEAADARFAHGRIKLIGRPGAYKIAVGVVTDFHGGNAQALVEAMGTTLIQLDTAAADAGL